jgi:signal transduction histidine kinase
MQMTSPTPRSRPYVWQTERHPVLLVVPYVLLAVLAAITLPWGHHKAPALITDISLCVFAALWMAGMYTLNRRWRHRQPVMAVFIAVLILNTWCLVHGDGWFGFFTVVTGAYSIMLLRWPWQLAGIAGSTLVAAASQTSSASGSLAYRLAALLFAFAIDTLIWGSFAWFLWKYRRQDEDRKRMLAELSEANARLEATIAENEDLHQRLVTQARDAGVRAERQRMAREIHDTLAQGLTGIVTQLQAAEQAAEQVAGNAGPAAPAAPAAPTAWRRHLAAATQLARESLTEARRSVHALRPEPLETGRLSEALADVAERWSARNAIPVQVTTTGTARIVQPEAEFALLRAAQEALANVAKHARATRVGLTVSYMESEVALDVRDDGVGFDPASPGHDGFGLIAMRQRIAALSGTLQVESEPGGGTAISACVPTVSVLAAT